MLFNFGAKSSILLIFFVNGIVFSILLIKKGMENNDKPSYWLSLFTILCTLYIAPFMLGYAGWYTTNPYRDILFYVPFQQLFLIPPVLYFYCKTLFDKSFVFQGKRNLIHFVPALLYLLYALIIFVTDKFVLGESYFYKDGRDKDFSFWYQFSGFAMLFFYLIKSLEIYNRYKAMTYDTISYADSLTFSWAKRFLLGFVTLLFIRLLFFILNPEWAEFGRKFWYYLLFSILFYYISISGFINSIRSVTSFKDSLIKPASHSDQDAFPPSEPATPHSDDPGEPEPKNEIKDIAIWMAKIETLMVKDKMYEDPELSIYHISQKLDTHSKRISQVINQGFSMNFNDYINQHRVKAAVQKIKAGEHTLQTLLGIGYACGFNSKSTFNRAFKRHTAQSPNDFIKKNIPE
jgi:AraC-like DNA-binding protein